eukprot:gene19710-25218_t
MGEPYLDVNGRAYTALIREPVFVYGATLEELQRTHQRALSRELVPAIYIEPMFATTNDADNRAAVAAAPVEAMNFVGIGVHGPRKAVDKVVGVYDLWATVLHLMGIDHEALTYLFSGRNVRLTDVHGHVMKEIIA